MLLILSLLLDRRWGFQTFDEFIKYDRSKDRKPDEDKGDAVDAEEDERVVLDETDQQFDACQSDDEGGQKPDCQVIELVRGENSAGFEMGSDHFWFRVHHVPVQSGIAKAGVQVSRLLDQRMARVHQFQFTGDFSKRYRSNFFIS